MISVSTHIATPAGELKGAILLYGGSSPSGQNDDDFDYATVHGISAIKGRPEVLPGRLMTERDLSYIYEQLAIKGAVPKPVRWIADTLLAQGADRLVWWTPPGHRSMFFRGSSGRSFDGHAVCPVPALVWMAVGEKDLYVFATKSSSRPTPETPLFQAPFFNVWGSGQVCVGNANRPKADNAFDPQAWEAMFFGSAFTHPNFNQKGRLIKGTDPVSFWKSQTENPSKRFPLARLAAIDLSVGDLVEMNTLDRIAQLDTPQGEF